MSMIGNLSRIPDNVRDALLQDPELINGVLYPESACEPPPKKEGFLARIFGKRKVVSAAAPPPDPIHSLAEGDTMDIDKAWHGLHFLFTGSDWEGDFPEGFLVSCGEPVGDVDVGYGPARAFTSAQVKEIARYLSSLDREVLRKRLDPDKMHNLEIYPGMWGKWENIDEEWGYLEGGLGAVTRFVSEAAERDMALLIYLN